MNEIEAIAKLNKTFRLPEAKLLLTKDWLKANLESGIDATGFCYIATEALFHMLGGKTSGLTPVCARYPEGTHWWLVDGNGNILDPTVDQYGDDDPPYSLGRKMGFLNGYSKPSKRAVRLMELALA